MGEELPNLREAQAVTEPALDHRPLLDTARPAVAARPSTGRMQREQDLADLLVTDRRRHADTGSHRGLEIPADGFRIEPELGGDNASKDCAEGDFCARLLRFTPSSGISHVAA